MQKLTHLNELSEDYLEIIKLKEAEAKLPSSCLNELKVLSDELVQTESILSTYWHLSPTMKVIARDGILVKVNPAWTNALGYSKEELEGHPYMELIHPDDRELTGFVERELKAGNKISNFVTRFKHKTEDKYVTVEWMSVEYSGIIYGSGIIKD